MKKILLGILLLAISFSGFSQRAAEFKNGITIQKEEVLASKFVSYGESYITNWRDLVLDDAPTFSRYFPNNGGYQIGRLQQLGITPSLHFIPAAVKPGIIYSLGKNRTNDLDVDRNSIATYLDEDRIIQTAAIDVARIDYTDGDGAFLFEDESTNLIKYSESPGHTYWTKSSSTIEGDATTAGSELITGDNSDFTGGLGDWASDNDWDSQTNPSQNMVLSGTSSTTQRCWLNLGLTHGKLYKITYTASSITGSPYFGTFNTSFKRGIDIVDGTNTSYIYADTQNGLLYIVSGTATAGVTIDDITLQEVQGFSAPDGTTNAFKLVEDNSNGIHFIQANILTTGSANNIYSFSMKVKSSERKIRFRLYSSTGNEGVVVYDLEDGTIFSQSGIDNVNITPLADGYFDCSMTITMSGTSDNLNFQGFLYTTTESYQGDGTSGVYIFGAQLEENSVSSSYIKSDSGSSTTRLADFLNFDSLISNNIISQSDFTMIFDISLSEENVSDFGGGSINFLTSGGTISFRIYFDAVESPSTNQVRFRTESPSVEQFNYTNSDVNKKIGIRVINGTITMFVNGVNGGDLTNTSTASSLLYEKIHFIPANIEKGGGLLINNITMYNIGLPNSTMLTLTTQ